MYEWHKESFVNIPSHFKRVISVTRIVLCSGFVKVQYEGNIARVAHQYLKLTSFIYNDFTQYMAQHEHLYTAILPV